MWFTIRDLFSREILSQKTFQRNGKVFVVQITDLVIASAATSFGAGEIDETWYTCVNRCVITYVYMKSGVIVCRFNYAPRHSMFDFNQGRNVILYLKAFPYSLFFLSRFFKYSSEDRA